MKLTTRFVFAAALFVLAAGAGYLGYQRMAAPKDAMASTPSAPTPSAPTPPVTTSSAPAIPDTLPAFTLMDRDGTPKTLADWSGRPLLINFWATWCAPCRREIPLLLQLRRERAREGLEVIGVAVDFREDVLKYAAEMGIDYPLLIGEQEGLDAAASFGLVPVFPFSVFADSRGRIVTVRIGELHADEAAFILDRVQDVDANRLDLAAAQQQIADKLRELAVSRAQAVA